MSPISEASASLSLSLKSMNFGFFAVQGAQPKPFEPCLVSKGASSASDS